MKKNLLKYGITFIVGCAMMIVTFFVRRDDEQTLSTTMRYLSDAALLPTVLIGGWGVLIFCSRGGTFNMISFGLKKIFFSIFRRNTENKETYYEYYERHSQKKTYYLHFLLVGVFFLILTVIFAILT